MELKRNSSARIGFKEGVPPFHTLGCRHPKTQSVKGPCLPAASSSEHAAHHEAELVLGQPTAFHNSRSPEHINQLISCKRLSQHLVGTHTGKCQTESQSLYVTMVY